MPNTQVQRSIAGPDAYHKHLIDLAVRGLPAMFDPGKQLFCYRLKQESGGVLKQEGLSPRYTIMALLGLHRCEGVGIDSPIDIGKTFNHLIDAPDWINNIGDLGLLMWLCAVKSPERINDFCLRMKVRDALATYQEAQEGRTTELAWFLTGLSHCALVIPHDRLDLQKLTLDTYTLLRKNQGPHGFFGHLAMRGTLSGLFRGRIGSFADQAYPIYALATFAEAFNESPALSAARSCAEAICRVQGEMGQWWWHYDAIAGRVSEKYPVYSVHQDGMAPMALFALGDATGEDFQGPIYKGLQWITGQNELGRDLRDNSRSIIWRSLFHEGRAVELYRKAIAFSRLSAGDVATDDLAVKFECRPYHLGWLLYAFAGRNPNTTA